MVYLPNDIFNIIKEYLISDYGSIMNLSKKFYNAYLLKPFYEPGDSIVSHDIIRNKKCNDIYLNEVSTFKFNKNIEFTREDSSIISFELPLLNDIDGNIDFLVIYKNLQFEGNIDNIEWIELHVGLTGRIETINMVFYKTLQKFYKMNGIPFYSFKYGHFISKYNPTKIIFKMNKHGKIKLKLDEYHKQSYNIRLEQFLYVTCHYDNFITNIKKKIMILILLIIFII